MSLLKSKHLQQHILKQTAILFFCSQSHRHNNPTKILNNLFAGSVEHLNEKRYDSLYRWHRYRKSPIPILLYLHNLTRSNPNRGGLATFTYVAWVKSNRVMTASVFKNKFFVEPHKIKRLLELVTEALLIVIAITFKLQKVNTPFYA